MKDDLSTYPDLASDLFGGEVVYATDDTYGRKENLIIEKDSSKNISSSNDTRSNAWMPSFEKNTNEWVVLRLGCETTIIGLEIEIFNEVKNATLQISIDAIHFKSRVEDWQLADFLDWDSILEKEDIEGNKRNYFDFQSTKPYTHVRLHLLSKGGISRCKVFGEAYRDWTHLKDDLQLDLAMITNGAKILAHSSTFSGSVQNLIAPKKSTSMADGWLTNAHETKLPYQWVIVKLAHKGFIEKLIIDTYNFYDNRAESCSLEYCIATNDQDVLDEKVTWRDLLDKKGLKPHRENPFSGEDIRDHEAITHVMLKAYPYGGLSRLRLIGNIKK
ncbi:MAG: hypothetical protein HKN90_01430 [Flavobacteriaceae bacterium]|nr:hypothetical protein [Flavobacteriaceae bacterium]